MPELATIGLFALACLALTVTPGPDMLLIATRSATHGRAAGIATYLGIATGSYCHALALALGLSQLFLMVPGAYDIVRYLGAIYLLYLAWQAFSSSHKDKVSRRQSVVYSSWTMYRQGLFTNILNPKMALFFLALFPQFLDPMRGSVGIQVMALATILNIIGFVVNGSVVLISARAKSFLHSDGRSQRIAKYLTGVVFAGLAARLAFDGQR